MMPELINTISVLGDDATTDAIIERTITEFVDDTITSLGEKAFAGCGSLVKVCIPNLTNISGNSVFESCESLTSISITSLKTMNNCQSVFNGCTSLRTIDFWALENGFYWGAFMYCSSLKALILRTGGVVVCANGNAFTNTPIASGTGYIYVPAALIDSYKAATNWSTYANQFRALEDYTVDGTTTGELDETKI